MCQRSVNRIQYYQTMSANISLTDRLLKKLKIIRIVVAWLGPWDTILFTRDAHSMLECHETIIC